MPATIVDIKNQTGLSLATISKYLNGGNVLPENKVKIEAAIKDLHYEVNEIARGLVTNKTRTIGVLVYSIESLFNGTLLHHIGTALRERGFGMLICDSNGDEETEQNNLKFLVNKKVDGIIVVPVNKNSSFLKPAIDHKIPIVLLDRPMEDRQLDCIRIDNRMAAYRAMKNLIDAGHERIAVISSGVEYTGVQRHYGFLDACKDAGIEVPESYQKIGKHSIEFGTIAMKELLSEKEKPTAVFMTNYEITLGAIMAINDSDYKCPDDISLLGFDDLILSHVVAPQMTMVVQPMKEMGEQVVELLLSRVNSKEEDLPKEIILSTNVQLGNSIKNLKK